MKLLRKNIRLDSLNIGIFAIFFALLFVICATRGLAQTQDSNFDLTVSPPVIELTAKPGQKISENFKVRNNLSHAINLKIQARRLISSPTDGVPVPQSDTKGEELKWVTFDKPEFSAKPREWTDISFTIDIPESAAYGYYYVFSITPQDQKEEISTGAQLKGELLVVTLLTVLKEGANSKTDLVSFKAEPNINEYLPVKFSVKLANKGNVHVKPRGNIFITRGNGKEISTLEVNQSLGSILPGGQREFATVWDDGFLVKEPVMENDKVKLDKNGNPVTKLTINWNKLTNFRIGPYTARLLMVYDNGTRDITIESATTFWVIPYTALAVIFVSLIVIFAILRFLLKWYVKQAIKKSKIR